MTAPGPYLLYIDDDSGLCRLVQKEFERNGYRVDTVTSGIEGIERIRESRGIDVVALDHHMPEQTGLETLAAIIALPDPPPVVYVTGEAEGRVAVAALKAGATDYVIKDAGPEFLTLLRAAIASAIEVRQQKRLREAAEAELRESRDRFEALANERAVLINEVNHRVSNSLQLVASLLQVQSAAQADTRSAQILLDAYKRVAAVARVHKRLYSSADVRYVDLADYLLSLVEDLRQSGDEGGSSLQFLASQTRIGADYAIPVGLLVTELVINALKHAYPHGGGPIRVKVERNGDLIMVQVEDDGVGIDEVQWRKSRGIGSKIVMAMIEKIGGALTIEPTSIGTRVTVTFTAKDPLPGSETAVTADVTSVLVVTESRGRERSAASESPPRLLLVEDDPLMRTVVAGNLEDAGFLIDEVGTCADARRLWVAGRYAAAIIDIGLPDGRGDHVAGEWRTADPYFPMILATGYDEKVAAAGFMASHFSRVLAKPYDHTLMLETLGALGVQAVLPAGAPRVRQEQQAPRPATN